MRASMFRDSCPSIAFTPGLVGLLLVSVEFSALPLTISWACSINKLDALSLARAKCCLFQCFLLCLRVARYEFACDFITI